MNRRGFLAALSAAAVAPTALVAPAAASYIVRYTHRCHGLAFAMTSELVTEGELEVMSPFARHLAQSMIETRETLIANLLNRAFEQP